jgi:nucleoside-diphosphate-sugar epimerase
MEVWRGAAEGLDVNVITPAIILGSGKWQDGSTALFKNVWKGVPFYPKGGNGFVDVRDVAWLAKAAMETEIRGQRIIANAENLSYRELFSMIARHLGVSAPARPLSHSMASLYILIRKFQSRLNGTKTIVTRQSVRLAQHRFSYPNDKSKALFDFKYRPVEETIRETAMQFREAASKNFSPRILPIDF